MELYGGVGYEHLRRTREIANPRAIAGHADTWSATVAATWDQTDHPTMPIRGARGRLAFQALDQKSEINQVDRNHDRTHGFTANALVMIPSAVSSRFSLFLHGEYGRYGTALPLHEYRLGGPGRLGSLPFDRMFGSEYDYEAAGIRYPLLFGTLGYGRVDALAYYETGNVRRSGVRLDRTQSVSLGIQAETLLGTAEIGISSGSDVGRARAFFRLGTRF